MNNDALRLVCIAIFAFSSLTLWQRWDEFEKEGRAPTAAGQASLSQQIVADGGESDLPRPTQDIRKEEDAFADDSAPLAPTVAGDSIEIETDWLAARVDLLGGRVSEVKLKKHRDQEGAPLALLRTDSHFYAADSGLVGEDDFPNHKTLFRFAEDSRRFDISAAGAQRSLTLILTAQSGGVRAEKSFVFRNGDYRVQIGWQAQNEGAAAISPFAYYQVARDDKQPDGESTFLPNSLNAVRYTDAEKYEEFLFDDLDRAGERVVADDGWTGIAQRYFLTALLFDGQREFFMRSARDGGARVGFLAPLGAIAPGAAATIEARLFVGAQEQALLAELSESGEATGIHLAVDYEWATIIAAPLFWLLRQIQAGVGNWGLAVILLTLLVKAVFYPLTAASYKSMARIKEMGPRIQRLKERFGDDKQAMQQAMMKMYREEKINPLGGCLPILVQMPVFIALYWVLLSSVEMRQAPFILWIVDLSAPDPFYILPLLLGGAMFLQMRMSPAPPDPNMALVMKVMPIMFAGFSVFFPSGLVLYWLVNTLLTMLQQWLIARQVGAKKAADAAARR